jgi:hypothetical protein
MSGSPDDPYLNPRVPDARDVEVARGAVAGPALLLILNGILGLILVGLLSVPFVFNPEGFVDWAEGVVAQQPPSPEKQQAEQDIAQARQQLNDPDARQVIVTRGAVILGIPAAGNLLAILGAIAMRRLSSYGLSLAGGIVSLIPLGTGCCLTGIPFGIWALVVLSRPEVKAGFLARRNAPPPDPDAQYLR